MVKNTIKAIMLLVLFTTATAEAEGWNSYLPKIDFNTAIKASKNISTWAQQNKELATLTSLMTFTFSTMLSYCCVIKLYNEVEKEDEDIENAQDFKSTSSKATSSQSTIKKIGWATGAGLSFLTALGSIVYSNAIF